MDKGLGEKQETHTDKRCGQGLPPVFYRTNSKESDTSDHASISDEREVTGVDTRFPLSELELAGLQNMDKNHNKELSPAEDSH